MDIRDVDVYRLETSARRAALSGPWRGSRVDSRARRRLGSAVVALGLRIAGEQLPAAASRYA